MALSGANLTLCGDEEKIVTQGDLENNFIFEIADLGKKVF